MKIAIYGLPCAGKTTLMEKISDAKIIHGSAELNRLSHRMFAELSEQEKKEVRIKYTDYINSLNESIIVSDGHYSFLEDVVFTDFDGDLYDVFFYLFCEPEIIKKRMGESDKNKQYSNLSLELIKQWQDYEIESLREECHKRNKDFYVISDNLKDECAFLDFFNLVVSGYSTYRQAKEIVHKIQEVYPEKCELDVIDGDKTLILQDSFRYCCNGETDVFDGNFYTGYQSFLFLRDTDRVKVSINKVAELRINPIFAEKLAKCKYVVLSAGIKELWDKIAEEHQIMNVFADIMISADTKYYVIKLLMNAGCRINAYGDSKNDLYMLRVADRGFLFVGEKISRSLKNTSLSNINLIYDKSKYILSEHEDLKEDIAICKSDSGINGGRLAAAHFRLGEAMGRRLSELFTEKDTAILVLERGGRFFGDGLYCTFGGTFYSLDPSSVSARQDVNGKDIKDQTNKAILSKNNLPIIKQSRVIIVDSVINSGKSVFKLIELIKDDNPDIDIIVATNVIQSKAVNLFKEYKLFAVRESENSFVGINRAKQYGKSGPDTADRLFNCIMKRFM